MRRGDVLFGLALVISGLGLAIFALVAAGASSHTIGRLGDVLIAVSVLMLVIVVIRPGRR